MVLTRAVIAGLILLGAALRPAASPFLHLYGSCRAVRDMAVDSDRLWLATSGGLVLYREGAEPVVYSAVDDMKDINLTSLVMESRELLWLGSAGGYVIEFSSTTERFTSHNSLAYAGWDITCMRPFGPYLLLGSSKGLSVFSRSTKRALWNATQFGSLGEGGVRAIETAGDTVAVVLPAGVAWLKAPDLRRVNLSDPGVWTTISRDSTAAAIIDGAGVQPHTRRIRHQGETTFEFADTIRKVFYPGLADSVTVDTTTALRRNGELIFHNWAPYTECAADFGGNVYAGTRDEHVYRLQPSGAAPEQVRLKGPPAWDVRQTAMDREGTLWFVMESISHGVGRFTSGKWSSIIQESDSAPGFGATLGGRPEAMNRVMVTSTDDVWVATFAHGAKWYRRQTGTWQNFTDTGFTYAFPAYSRYPSPVVRYDAAVANWWTFVGSICEDSTGMIWIGQERPYTDRIIHVFDPQEERWRSLTEDEYGFAGSYTRALAAARHPSGDTQYVYVGFHAEESGGHFGFSVVRFTDAMDGALSVTHAYPTSSVHDIAVAGWSVGWVATSSGLCRFYNSDVLTFRQMQRVRPTSQIYTVALSPAGHPLFAMDGDLWEYRDSVFEYGAGQGRLVSRDSLVNLTGSGLLGSEVYDICSEPSEGRYWISTGKGLFRFSTGEYVQPLLSDYSSVVVYPNPLSRSKRAPEVFFDRLAQGSRVTVYDVAGMMVWRSGPGDVHGGTSQLIRWNGRNASGALVRPGTYYYYIHVGDAKRLVGKLLVIP